MVVVGYTQPMLRLVPFDSKQEIKAAVLRTLTAIIHFEKDPRYASNCRATLTQL